MVVRPVERDPPLDRGLGCADEVVAADDGVAVWGLRSVTVTLVPSERHGWGPCVAVVVVSIITKSSSELPLDEPGIILVAPAVVVAVVLEAMPTDILLLPPIVVVFIFVF